jgi:hypothetical protein
LTPPTTTTTTKQSLKTNLNQKTNPQQTPQKNAHTKKPTTTTKEKQHQIKTGFLIDQVIDSLRQHFN